MTPRHACDKFKRSPRPTVAPSMLSSPKDRSEACSHFTASREKPGRDIIPPFLSEDVSINIAGRFDTDHGERRHLAGLECDARFSQFLYSAIASLSVRPLRCWA